MAEISATQGARDEPVSLTTESRSTAVQRVNTALARPLVLLWVAFVSAAFVFLAFGTVRIGAGSWAGLRLSVRRIWENFSQYLTEQGASSALVAGVTAAVVLALAGAALLLWLAFDLKDAHADPPEGAAEQ